MGARFAQVSGAEVAYKKSGGGVFEISVGDELKFSKKRLGRFPTDDEVEALAKALA
jgi:selT/selW/selH-like putative selenoprotein